MKTLCVLYCLIAASTLPGTATASPKQDGAKQDGQSRTIVVQASPVTLKQWSKTISNRLEDGIRYPAPMWATDIDSGIVTVRFQCGEDGRPTALTLNRKSGSGALNRAAMRAVSHIKTLHPLPAGLKPTQVYEAHILFARSEEEYRRQIVMLRKEAERRNAWFKDSSDTNVIAINASPAISGNPG